MTNHRISINEARQRLGVGRVTLWRWIRNGLMPSPHQYGPNTLGWPPAEFEEFFADPEGWREKNAREREAASA